MTDSKPSSRSSSPKPTHRRLGSNPLKAFGANMADSNKKPASRSSSPKPTHRRLGSKPLISFGPIGGEPGGEQQTNVTTSKAVLVSVIAPCLYYTESEPTIEEVADDDNKKKKMDETTEAEEESESSSSSAEEEEEATDGSSRRENEKQEFAENANKMTSLRSETVRSVLEPSEEDAIPMREDLATTQRGESITMEEASAVKRQHHNPLAAEINIEELLRIAFQALLDERYLLSVPTFSRVEDKKVIRVPLLGSMTSLEEDVNGKPTPWIRVEAMALPNSLGMILERLERVGVGTIVGTVSVYKVELCRTASPYLAQPQTRESSKDSAKPTNNINTKDEVSSHRGSDAAGISSHRGPEHSTRQKEDEEAEDFEKQRNERLIEEAKAEWKNAATRLRIEQIREQIGEQAALSFDFLSLLTIAGILAGIGLAMDNTVVIVASMLVSPIMGPVLGLTFGTQVKDWPLVKGSFINETVALTVCLFIGILVGLCVGFTTYARESWPTNEMTIRGDPIGLVTGVAVAIPSGAGVCLSVIGGNTSSLVGVAISASLLPPAVNAGICFMHALLLGAGAVETDNNSDLSALDIAEIGAISFALTVVNIVCIWMAGIVMFHIKEVSPAQNKGAFWARDLRVARELNEKGNAGEKPPPVDTSVLRNGILSAFSKKHPSEGKPKKPVKIIAPRSPNVRTYSAGGANLNTAFAFKPKRSSVVPSETLWWRDLVETTSTVQEEDAEYVNLDELADLLGLGDDDDDDDDVIPPIYWSRRGRGRYI